MGGECTKRKNIFMVLAIILSILGISVGYAANWVQNISWHRGAIVTFTVDESTTIIIPDPETSYKEDFHIHNTGNVEIRVSSAVSFSTGSSADVTWNPATVDIPVGGQGILSLTLSNFSVGDGSVTITFTSIVKPTS